MLPHLVRRRRPERLPETPPSRRASRSRGSRTRPSPRPTSSRRASTAPRSSPTAASRRTARSANGTDDEQLLVHVSTQNVSGIAAQMAEPLGIPAGEHPRPAGPHRAAGSAASSGPTAGRSWPAQLSKKAGGKPVKMMLERDAEQSRSPARGPRLTRRSRSARRRTGPSPPGSRTAGARGGMGGGGAPPIPYVLDVPNRRIAAHRDLDQRRAARGPGARRTIRRPASSPWAPSKTWPPSWSGIPWTCCCRTSPSPASAPTIYNEELQIAADLMGWKKSWHPRGDKAAGPVKRGLGLSLHTWGGRGHDSNCDVTIHPDGSVEVKLGTQDLGTGTRTCIEIVVAETARSAARGDQAQDRRQPVPAVRRLGRQHHDRRRFRLLAPRRDRRSRAALRRRSRPALGVTPDGARGRRRARSGSRAIRRGASPGARPAPSWAAMPVTARGATPKGQHPTSLNSGVGGVQMADVSVDVETGIVKVNKMVAVQDCGLIIDLKTRREPVLRGAHHGHLLRALRREGHGRGDRPDAQPEHGVLQAGRASATSASWWCT